MVKRARQPRIIWSWVDTRGSERHCRAMKILIVLCLVGLVILWPLARYAVFLISNYRAGYLPFIRKQLGGLAKPIFRGVITAMGAEAIALPAYPLGWLPQSQGKDEGVPILMVHGLFHNSSAWILFKHRLKKAGYTNLHTYQYNSFTKDFTHAVAGLQTKMDDLLGGRTDGKVVLIGHSQGGLVCRCVAGNPKYRDNVAALVTLGSPHKGSDLARFGGNKMSRDLIPGHYTPEAVDRCPDPDCPKLGIYNLVDDFVFPLDMLQTDRSGWQERLCSPMGHVWMLYSREVFGMTVEFLHPILDGKKS